MSERKYSLTELRELSEQAYSHRWHIGKDHHIAILAFLDAIFFMERDGYPDIATWAKSICRSHEDYVL